MSVAAITARSGAAWRERAAPGRLPSATSIIASMRVGRAHTRRCLTSASATGLSP
jgi:hypothetical protein